MVKKIVFVTGTRADFGKLKPLIDVIQKNDAFECHIFVTGMHMLSKYGQTITEIEENNYNNIYPFNNQTDNTDMDVVLSNTIVGFGNYVKELNPDMIIVHGDRVEALAGAVVGMLVNVLVAHIEGGEVSGTVDEVIRHTITKMSHIHLVANEAAKKRVIQLGERKDSIFVIGSPDIDIMTSDNLPSLEFVKTHYEIPYKEYAIFCYHPVTTELEELEIHIKEVVNAAKKSKKNYVVIYPNNDTGSEIILREIKKLKSDRNFRILPSMRFESYLTLLKNAKFIIGNSSAGIREAIFYGVPSINIGSRQNNRSKNKDIIHVGHNAQEILEAIEKTRRIKVQKSNEFGDGRSASRFLKVITDEQIWDTPTQKQFVDI